MATDWVHLFDLDLARMVFGLDGAGLRRFLAESGQGLAERDRRLAHERYANSAQRRLALLDAQGLGVPPWSSATPVLSDFARRSGEHAAAAWGSFAERLLVEEDFDRLRFDVAWAAGMLSDNLHVDYWGCLAALSDEVLKGCESNRVLDPDPYEEDLFFFKAPQLDAMIASLRAHWSEVRVMDEADLRRLIEYRERCASERGLRVAYHIDH
jgi:hypothetical protein